MSIIIENATCLTLKHILCRHTCKQNMAYITQVTNKHLDFLCVTPNYCNLQISVKKS